MLRFSTCSGWPTTATSPVVDDRVLTFLQPTTFHHEDFIRVSDGSCRLHPQLARAIVAVGGVPQQRLKEHATWLAGLLRH
jgi:hypothetical protein